MSGAGVGFFIPAIDGMGEVIDDIARAIDRMGAPVPDETKQRRGTRFGV